MSTKNYAGNKFRSRTQKLVHAIGGTATAVVFVAFMVLGIGALHYRANAEIPPEANPPIVVEVRPLQLTDHYEVADIFVGILEPARQTNLAFERNGLVTEILFDEGDTVEAGEVVARLDTALLESRRLQFLAELKELEARRDLAAATNERQGSLKTKGWSTDQRYDEARFSLSQTEAAIESLQASIRSIEINLEKSVLRAPYAGRIGERSVDEGSVVNAGAPIFELLEADHRQARVGLSVEAGRQIRSGVRYRFFADGQEFSGTLNAKRPDLKKGTRTVTALFDVSGAQSIPFGETVEFRVERQISARGGWVPIAALSEGLKGLWTIYKVDKGASVVQRESVEVLHSDGERVYVRGNLIDGDAIILEGTNRIVPGQHVSLKTED